jgi:hypothetical protein
MGNKLAVVDVRDSLGPEKKTEFFKKVRVKWIESFMNQHKANSLSDFTIEHDFDRLKWVDYYRLISVVKSYAEADVEKEKRNAWHPATMGFMMNRSLNPYEMEEILIPIPDDFTEDEASDLSGSDTESVEGLPKEDNVNVAGKAPSESKLKNPKTAANVSPPAAQKTFKPPAEWDVTKVSPIYFGYEKTTVQSFETVKRLAEKDIEEAENRAVMKATNLRASALEDFENGVRARESSRLKRIEEVEKAYKMARDKREAELARNKSSLPELGFTMFKKQWNIEYNAAEEAYLAEVGRLRAVHESKTVADLVLVTQRREDMEAFRDAAQQQLPAAERLEEIAKAEMSRWIEEIDVRTDNLSKISAEYQVCK